MGRPSVALPARDVTGYHDAIIAFAKAPMSRVRNDARF
jgi:hypothetical protein